MASQNLLFVCRLRRRCCLQKSPDLILSRCNNLIEMVKILVADDETDLEILIMQRFRQQISEKKYPLIYSFNGNQALEQLKADPEIAILLSDIKMPELDGLTLLSKINEVCPLVKTVMVSAYGDMDNIRMAMNLGAFDFVCKPVNFADL